LQHLKTQRLAHLGRPPRPLASKRSIILDLRQSAAQEMAHRLVQRSDVLVHNFRPGVMARLGEHTQEMLEWLGYDTAYGERLRQEHVV
jgi:crotonobetainyl-CoA:carnitine CoA-transferase CaiB-like acyl-CoA transferase